MKKTKLISLITFGLLVVSALAYHAQKNYLSWRGDPFLFELYNAAFLTKEKRGDIKNIVEKYIPIETERKTAIRFLSNNGFVVRQIDSADLNWSIPCQESWYSAEKSFSPLLIVKATVYIEIHTAKGLVNRVDGKVWYSGL